jgi:hypothetical protein
MLGKQVYALMSLSYPNAARNLLDLTFGRRHPVLPITPFRLLDLPAKLRVEIFSFITPPSHAHEIKVSKNGKDAMTVFLRKALPVALLRTCKLIKREATPTL